MARPKTRRLAPPGASPRLPANAVVAVEFAEWWGTLDAERRTKVDGAIARIAGGGSTMGGSFICTIRKTSLHKLKEARVDRGVRLLFARDTNQKLVMLVGGDKTGEWNGWYDRNVRDAETRYEKHERSIGKGAQCLGRRESGKTSSQRSL
jgi:hypothetical protein